MFVTGSGCQAIEASPTQASEAPGSQGLAGKATQWHEAGSLLLQATGTFEGMMNMLNLLLELGGDPSRVNVVGNDLVAIAASAGSRGLWDQIIRDQALLARCTAKHAGRVALQLFAALLVETWAAVGKAPETKFKLDRRWCGEQLLDSLQPVGITPYFQVQPLLG